MKVIDLDIECEQLKYVDSAKVGRIINTDDDRLTLETGLNRLYEQSVL